MIAQDIPNRRGQSRSDAWRVPAGQESQINMSYLANLRHRMTFPGTRARPYPNPEQTTSNNPMSYYFMNCPRCGADNRNWLNVLQTGLPRPYYIWIGFLLVIAILLATLFRQAPALELKRLFPLLVFIALAGLLPLIYIPNIWYVARLHRYLRQVSREVNRHLLSIQAQRALLILGICVVGVPVLFYGLIPVMGEIYDRIAGFEPPPSLSAQVITVRQDLDELAYPNGRAGTAVNPFDTLPSSATTALEGLHQLNNTYLNNCTAAQFNYWTSLLKTVEEVNPPLIQSVNEQLAAMQPQCQPEMVASVVATLDEIAGTMPPSSEIWPFIPFNIEADSCYLVSSAETTQLDPGCRQVIIESVKDGLQNLNVTPVPFEKQNWQTILGQTQQLAALSPSHDAAGRLETHVTTISDAINGSGGTTTAVIDRSYFKVWFLAAGLAWLVATICGYLELNRRVSFIDPLLPQPVFTTLTNMTRVAVWEMKKTLEVPGDTSHIQWMRAERQNNGGIRLLGLHRSLPKFDHTGAPVGSVIRAQRYTIETDMWVRITRAVIEDVEVPHTVSPAQFMVTESWSREYVPPLPSNGNGYLSLGTPTDHRSPSQLTDISVPPEP